MNYTIARKNGSGAIVWSEDQVRYIINEYKYKTLNELSKEFNVQPQSIRNLLRKQRIKIDNGKEKKYPRNSYFFHNISTPEQAYWLGMMLSDGSITNNNSVNLGLKDKEHIEKWKKAIEATNHKIIIIHDYRFSKECVNYRLSIKDKWLVQDLAQYNVVPNKTYISFDFPNIPQNLESHFIRGYFDGDGSIYFTSKIICLSWVGNKIFLTSLKNKLNYSQISLCQNSQSKITFDFKIRGYKNVIPILQYMYKDSYDNIRLERKYKIVHNILSNQALYS